MPKEKTTVAQEENAEGQKAAKGSVTVNSTVHYVPHECHAKDFDPVTSRYAWQWELESVAPHPRSGDRIEQLTHARAREVFAHLGTPMGENLRSSGMFRPVRPVVTWLANVQKVNEDGTLNLHVRVWSSLEKDRGDVVIGDGIYAQVPHDPTGKTPHSWHTLEEGAN